MVCAGVFPSPKECGKKRVYDFLIEAFSVGSKFPEFSAYLNEDGDSGGKRAIEGFCRRSDEGAGHLQSDTNGSNLALKISAITYLLTTNIDRSHFRHHRPKKRHLLVHMNALSNKLLSQPPHIISTEILVLKSELDEVCRT